MSVLITTLEHDLAIAAQKIVADAKFVETKVLPVLQKAQAQATTIESVTALVDPNAANIERVAFAVLGTIINAVQAAGAAAGANGLNVALDASLVTDVKAVASAVQSAVPAATAAK